MNNSSVHMTRPSALYIAGVLVILLLAVLIKKVEGLGLSALVPQAGTLSATLFAIAALAGLGCTLLHLQRIKAPWRVPQARVSLLFVLATAGAVLAILFSK